MNAVLRRAFSFRMALVAGGLGAGLLLAPALAGLVLAPRTGEGRPPDSDPADPGAARFLAAIDRAREGDLVAAREHLVAAAAAGVPEASSHLAEVDRRLAADAEAARAELVRLAAAVPEDPAVEAPKPALRRPAADMAPDRALSALRAGRLAEARAAVAGCRSDRCRSIDGALAAVETAIADRSNAGRGPALEAALATVRRLGGGPIEKAIGEELAPWYHAAGVEALRRGDPGAARERFDRALSVQPGYPPALAERERLRERARQAFLAAYTEKDASPAEARQKFRLVTTITGPDDEVHRKARRWLERLDAGTEGGPTAP